MAILFTTVVWSSSLIIAKIVFDPVNGITPIVFVALRYTIACPFLVVAAGIMRKKSESSNNIREHWKIILILGLSGPFLSQVLQYIGLNFTTASDAVLLLNMTPVFAVILAAPILSEKITLEKVVGLFLATLGATLIVLNTTTLETTFGIERLLGDLIIIVSTLLFAVNGIAGKIAVKSMDSVSVTLYSIVAAVPLIWLSAAIFEDITVVFRLSFVSWILILWVGVINTAFAFVLYYDAMNHIEASQVQIALNLIAVWGVLMSIFVLGEASIITPLLIIGGGLTILGVVIAQWMHRSHNSEDLV
jgi:drug/metabolite transporter (DMT)-like permease